ncbi:MAG: flavin reductase family protein [Acidimicrobiales bacterium]
MVEARPIVAPIPVGEDAEEYDRRRRRVLWTMPAGLYVLGSCSGEERNLMTLDWAVQVAVDPKLVAVSVEKASVTHRMVEEEGVFSLNILAREDRALVRRFVKPAVVARDGGGDLTLNGFPVREVATGAPVLEQALAYLDCRVHEALRLGSHTLFVGEVADAGFNRAEDTPVLRMEDTRMSYGG